MTTTAQNNSLEAFIPRLMADGPTAFYTGIPTARNMSMDLDSNFIARGENLRIGYTQQVDTSDVVPSANNPDSSSIVTNYKTVSVDNWKKASAVISDDQGLKVTNGTWGQALVDAARSLGQKVEDDAGQFMSTCWARGKKYGTGNAQPFKTTLDAAADANKSLFDEKSFSTMENRSLLWNSQLAQNASLLTNFIEADKAGTNETLRGGMVNEAMGFTFTRTHTIKNFTQSNVGGTPLVNGALKVGARTFRFDGNTGNNTYKVGDILQLGANGPQVVVEGIDGDTVTFGPYLEVAVADNAPITTMDLSGQQNVAYDRNAVKFINRPIDVVDGASFGNVIRRGGIMMPDGNMISMRLELRRENKQIAGEWDILYDFACLVPQHGFRIVSTAV